MSPVPAVWISLDGLVEWHLHTETAGSLRPMSATYPHLIHIENHSELHLYELIPDIVWIFDVDEHRWWWGNQAALKYWGLDSVNQLVHKDLSGDTQGARDRIWQTFELAQQQGLTTDPWTTYPGGKPKTLLMRHRAVLVGPEKHRAIIAYINEQVSLGEEPEHLLLVEAMRYTRVLVSSFDLSGKRITENPAATQAYTAREQTGEAVSDFVARFADREQGQACWSQAKEQQGGAGPIKCGRPVVCGGIPWISVRHATR